MWFILAIVLIATLLAYFEFVYKRDINRRTGNFKRLKGEIPLFGFGLRMLGLNSEQVLVTMEKVFEETGGAFAAWFGPQLMVGISDPERIQTVFNSNECLDKAYVYKFLHNKTGLFAVEADIWKVHRRALNPTFNPKILQGFIPIINEKTRVCVQQLENLVDCPIDVHRPVYKVITDILVNTALDTKLDVQSTCGDKLYDTHTQIMNCFQHRMYRVWLKSDFIYNLTPTYRTEMRHFKYAYKFLRGIKHMKEKELAEKLDAGIDVIENSRQANTVNWIQKCFWLYRQGKYTEENLIEEIDTMYVGGTDTTTSTVSSTIIMLAIHQSIQNRVIDELRDILGDDADREITYDDATKMTYLEMVIKETLRHYPIAPYLGRSNSTNDLNIKDCTIPKGSFVLINVTRVHKDPKIWGPNVDKFYPDHFLPENISNRHPYSYLAFSAGPRNCIGIKYGLLVSKIIIAYILRRYKLTSHLEFEDIRPKIQMILNIANANPVKFGRRDE